MARQSFISNLGGYALKKLKLLVNGNTHEYDTAQPVEVTIDTPAQAQSDWNQTNSAAVDYIKNKPANLVQDANYVHTDNNFTDNDKDKLDGIETGAEKNVQADWNQSNSSADDYIKNKPTIPQPVQSDWTETDSADPSYIQNKPNLATVATSGRYNDLQGKPAIPAAQVQSDWNQSNSSAVDYIKNKPQYTTTKFDGTNLVYNGSLATYTPPANSVCICDDFDGGWNLSLLDIDVPNQANNNITIILKDMDVASGSGISVWGSAHRLVSGYMLIVFIRGNQVQFLDIPPKDKLEYVAQLPAQPDPDTYYFIPE